MKGKILFGILLIALLIGIVYAAASFTVSTNSITFLQPDNLETFSITPSNSINITIDTPTNIKDNLGNTISVTATPSSFTNITTTSSVNVTSNVDYSKLSLGKTYSGNMIVKNTDNPSDNKSILVSFEKSYCSNGEAGGNLSVSDIDINNDGEGDEDTWYPLDEIEMKITVDNNNADEDDKIDTIVKAGLYDSDGKEQLDLDKLEYGKIKGGDDKAISVTFEVPSDLGIDNSNYKLYIKAYKDGKESNICTSETDDISIDREDDEDKYVILKDITIEPSSTASCGDELTLAARVINVGDSDQDKVKISLYNKELGLNLYQIVSNLDEGDEQDVDFIFKIPENISEKTYRLELINRYDYDDDYEPEENSAYDESSISFYETLNVQNCLETLVKNAAITASLQTSEDEVKAGNEIAIKATLINTGKETTTYILSLEGNEAFSATQNINPISLILEPGKSGDSIITLKINDDASGEYTFNIKAAFDTKEISQQFSLSVAESEAGFSITGSAIGESFRENWFIWVIVLINIVLIIAIILVAVKISRA